ncbi:Asparagine synthetase [glutamine-hydrolyzing] 1 [Oceanibacterium hippocampi]|uniref:asparagine synthase (glutamine-hydrolyzing) n=2 Tax=Oceanibacterium hippocampi TaxID=745714 RepID=A0A1Y5RQG4_9PROT|nr:Asparagine synthetase [glutamine-hydrolyzing] 1 [Oceanibacterium hippocampi]
MLARMLSAMVHRGPDNEGIWQAPGIALGHRRLSIVDLSPAGNQPMRNDDGDTILVCNGEIYNAPALAERQRARGARFHSRSDNEVLLHGYRQEGLAAFPTVNGMFAAAIWDTERRRLVLARDRLGIKPLYVREHKGLVLFASEIKAILAAMPEDLTIDPTGLGQYLAFENCFEGRGLLAGIEMVQPGEIRVFDADGGRQRTRFWSLAFAGEPDAGAVAATDEGLADRFVREAGGAVHRHLMSDVPVAAYLSAGFDSTTVAHFAAGEGPLRTFTGSFGAGGWYDEAGGAAEVAAAIGSRHETVTIDAGDFAAHFDAVVAALDEPRMGPGAFSQYVVARRAASDVKVILTGHGGDEFFSGYPVFKIAELKRRMTRNPLAAAALLASFRASEWPHLGYFLLRSLAGGETRHGLPVLFDKAARRRLMGGEDPGEAPDAALARMTAGEDDPYRRLMAIYVGAYLPGLFMVEDKISMAHSLESRTPLCDNDLVDFALSIAPDRKLAGGVLKAIPKRAMRGRLPEGLYRMPKRGFPTPLARWFRGELRSFVEARLLDPEAPVRRLLAAPAVDALTRRYLAPREPRHRILDELPTRRIWALLSLDSWLRGLEGSYGIRLGS